MIESMKPRVLFVEAGPGFITLKNEGYGITASIKWDGCANIEFADEDNPWHACDFDYFVAVLDAMKTQALDYFGGEFSIGCLTDEMVAAKVAAYET